MGKRKHGTASVSMTFSTRHYEKLRAMKVSGENVSAFIDRSIEHYDQTFLPHQRGKDPWEVEEQLFRRNLAAIKKHIRGNRVIRDANGKDKSWIWWLQAQIALEEDEEE